MVFVNFLFSICEYMYIYAFSSTMIIAGYTLHREENNLSSVVYMNVLIRVSVDRIQCKKLCLCLSFCLFVCLSFSLSLSLFLSLSQSLPLSLSLALALKVARLVLALCLWYLVCLTTLQVAVFWCPSSNHCQSQLCHRFALVHIWHLVHSRQLRFIRDLSSSCLQSLC